MKKLFSLFIVLLLVFGCKEEILLPELKQGEDGLSTIFAFDVLAPTDTHLNGGWLFNIGYDVNGDSTLNDDEITASAPLWHGNDGINGIDGKDGLNGVDGIDGTDGKDGVDGQTPNLYLVTVDLPATEGHENGGILVTTVWDKNNNGLIEEGDIVGAYTVWHGNNGADGLDGSDGKDGKSPYIGEDNHWYYWDVELNIWVDGGESRGADGADGQDGIDGKSPYILNGYWFFWNGTVWVNGGKSQGEDGNDGATGAQGEQGERGTIVGYSVSTALNCDTNGYRVTMTIDEGLQTEYELWFEVCDGRVGDTGAVGPQGPKGDDGYTTLMILTPKDDDGCVTIYTGLDINRNGQLDRDEVNYDQARTICDGLNSLVFVSEKIDGCIYISNGLDLNGDGELSRDEVINTESVCDGLQGEQGIQGLQGIPGIQGTTGAAGADGKSVIVTSTEAEGCVTITLWSDEDDSGDYTEGDVKLDEGTVCGGADGRTSIVLAERFTRSGYSGVKITTGFDTDGDLSTIERVLSTSYILDGTNGTNGQNGETTTITLEKEGDCVIITTYLGETEIDSEEICGCSLDCGGDCDDDEEGDCEPNLFGKVLVCHQQSIGQSTYYFPLWVNENALSSHLDHGDYCGPCEDND